MFNSQDLILITLMLLVENFTNSGACFEALLLPSIYITGDDHGVAISPEIHIINQYFFHTESP